MLIASSCREWGSLQGLLPRGPCVFLGASIWSECVCARDERGFFSEVQLFGERNNLCSSLCSNEVDFGLENKTNITPRACVYSLYSVFLCIYILLWIFRSLHW